MKPLITSLLLSLLTTALGCGSETTAGPVPPVEQPPVDYVIVAADTLAGAADRYREYRQGTGHQVAVGLMSEVVGGEQDAAVATELIRQYVRGHYDVRDADAPMFLLIIGDSTADWAGDLGAVPAGAYYDDFNNGQKITSDNVYADMDGDHMPDLAVGRIAAATEGDVDLVRQKVQTSESIYQVGPWNRRVNAFASTAGFGGMIDDLIETLAFTIVESASYDFDVSMTYAKQDSPFVFIPEQFSDKVYERINEGALWVVYVGHGDVDAFATLEWNGSHYPILDTAELDELAVTHRQPILCVVACLTGAFDSGDSFSERVLKAAGGPSAILSSTEISHPLTNAIFIYESSQVVTHLRPSTLGEVFVMSKERMVNHQDALRDEIDSFGELMLAPGEAAALLLTHLHMYTLFGDPGARIVYPQSVTDLVVSPSPATTGSEITIAASLGDLGDGDGLVTLETTRSVLAGELESVPADGDPNRDAVIAANYQTANDKVIVSQSVSHSAGGLSATLQIPADLAAGDYYVKIYADDGASDAMGSVLLVVEP